RRNGLLLDQLVRPDPRGIQGGACGPEDEESPVYAESAAAIRPGTRSAWRGFTRSASQISTRRPDRARIQLRVISMTGPLAKCSGRGALRVMALTSLVVIVGLTAPSAQQVGGQSPPAAGQGERREPPAPLPPTYAQMRHNSGQNVQPVFEGWNK